MLSSYGGEFPTPNTTTGELAAAWEHMNLKYYLYISDVKVDMLISQIAPQPKKQLSAELGINLGVLRGSVSGEIQSVPNRTARLEFVLSYIRENGDVGTVDDSSDYFEDNLNMRWGPYVPEPKMVYFTGISDGGTVLGLGGSTKHLIGESGSDHIGGYSLAPSLLGALAKDPELAADLSERTLNDNPSKAMSIVYSTAVGNTSLTQRVEFFAKRLLLGKHSTEEDRSTMVLLGTPLFVALAE